MFSYRFRRISLRLVAIALLACWFAIATSPILSPTAAQDDDQERTKTFPYPTQLVPGQSTCIVLDRHEIEDSEELTPQEDYAKKHWSLPERWVWRQVCTGKEANFLNIFQYCSVNN